MPDPQALSITYAPIAVPGVPALARHRLGYVEHTFLRAENYAAADPDLVTTQAGIGSLRHWVMGWSRPSTRCDVLSGAVRLCPTEQLPVRTQTRHRLVAHHSDPTGLVTKRQVGGTGRCPG